MLIGSYRSSRDVNVDVALADLEEEENHKESEGAFGYESSVHCHAVLLNFI